MTDYRFDQLVEIDRIRSLLESHQCLTRLAYCLLDTDGKILIDLGWPGDRETSHRRNPTLGIPDPAGCACKPLPPGDASSGPASFPIIIEGEPVATLYAGLFPCPGDLSDPKLLGDIPVPDLTSVHRHGLFLRQMLQHFAEDGLARLRLAREMEARHRDEEEIRLLGQVLDHADPTYLLQGPKILYANRAACDMLGYNKEEFAGMTVLDIDPVVTEEQAKEIEQTLDREKRITHESVHRARDGRLYDVEITSALFSSDGRMQIISQVRDITERKRTEDLLHKREQEFRAMIEHAPDPVIRYDRDGRRIYVNPAFEKLMGKPARLLLGRKPFEVPAGKHVEVGIRAQKAIERVVIQGLPAETEVSWDDANDLEQCYHIRFVPEFDRDGRVATVLSIARDIGPIKAYQRQLHDFAFFDILTGLPNRALFLDHLQQAVADDSLTERNMVGLMLLDLDQFKAVNDSFGHSIGDRLLCEVGRRLRQNVREGDMVARLGGDEFAIILPDIPHCETLSDIAGTLLTALAEPFHIQGKLLNVTAGIGIASCPGDSRDAWELVQLADMAMYHARSRGRNHFLFSSAELTTSAKKRLSLEAALHNALKQQEFELYYQPTVELTNGRLVGAEALLRWHHPELGIMAPGGFIGLAEETGMIIELGEWVLREACLTAREWNRAGKAGIKVAINLSVRQFDRNNLVESAKSILAETQCRPEWLELEITESLLLEERDDILTSLRELRRMGFAIAMDDFGTGYSGLGYLTKFPIDTLKIDRSFVSNIFTQKTSETLVKAVVSLARALNLSLVAEGVETCEQAAFLKDIGCLHAQGYLFGKPVPRRQFEGMTRQG